MNNHETNPTESRSSAPRVEPNITTNAAPSTTAVSKKCKCGGTRRRGRHDCLKCHCAAVKASNKAKLASYRSNAELVESWIFNKDRYTCQRFLAKIETYHVLVFTDPPEPEYVGIPIGFLPDDEVIVWHVPDRAISIVNLKKLIGHGPKRRQVDPH